MTVPPWFCLQQLGTWKRYFVCVFDCLMESVFLQFIWSIFGIWKECSATENKSFDLYPLPGQQGSA